MQLRAIALAGLVGVTAACVPTPPPTAPAPTLPAPTLPAPTTTATPTTAAPTTTPTTAAPTTTVAPPLCAPYLQTTPTGGADPFNITVATLGDADCYAVEIAAAVARWESIVTSGFAPTTIDFVQGNCGVDAPSRRYAVDDLEIVIDITAIDGPGGTLGMAGPCFIVGGTRPVFGVMQLDAADIAGLRTGGRLVDTLAHEIGHILGIGTMWDNAGLAGGDDTDPVFTGTHAVAAWQALGGAGDVPVENTGGGGTRLAHWRETTFDHELMTGWLESGRANPLSTVTIASLRDLGYSVDPSKADAYTLPAGLRWGGLVSGFGHGENLHTEPITPVSVD